MFQCTCVVPFELSVMSNHSFNLFWAHRQHLFMNLYMFLKTHNAALLRVRRVLNLCGIELHDMYTKMLPATASRRP